MTLEEVAQHLGARKNNIKRRNLKLLLELELLDEVDGGYVTPTNIEERLEVELRESGQLKAEELQRERCERERAAYKKAMTPHKNRVNSEPLPQEDKVMPSQVTKEKEDSLPEDDFWKGAEERKKNYKVGDFIDERDTCIHGSIVVCYLHKPYHPYRLKLKEEEEALAA